MASMSPAPPMVLRPKPPSAENTGWKMLLELSIAKSAVVKGTPLRAAWGKWRTSIGRVRSWPWVSMKETRITSIPSASTLAMMSAS